MMTRSLVLVAVLSALVPATTFAQGTRLLRRPTVSRDLVAFAYGGDIWTVARTGGQARRLTATPQAETDPRFSPDGSHIAFTGTFAGNTDVYVVPTTGGEPARLTYHPGVDAVRGWTRDGRRVIFGSSRGTLPTPGATAYFRLWTIALDPSTALGASPSTPRKASPESSLRASGLPEPLPMPRAFNGTYSPDGKRIAYEEIAVAMFAATWAQTQSSQWRHYRGGRTHPIRLLDVADNSVEKLPWTNSNDTDPMWIGNTVYFLSDRNLTTNLFAYRVDTKELTQITHHDDFDIMSASAGPDAVVYEQSGVIHLFDATTGKTRRLTIEVAGDFPWARPHFKKVASLIRSAALSPTGVRAAFEARGEILTVPAHKGNARNLTQSADAHDRSPVWAPDGTQLAWLSDASGEYQLMIGEQTGATKPRAIALPSTAFFSGLAWAPDGKHVVLQDNHLHLWVVEIATGRSTKVDTDTYDDPGRRFEAVWSPDSRWIAYSKSLDSHLRAIFLYSIVDRRAYQVTDGLSDAITPAFDANGKYLYFLASTNYALRTGWVEMSSVERPVTRAIYLLVLSASEPSPLLPETGDEPTGPTVESKQQTPVTVRVDFDRIGQRILALNVPAGDYGSLVAGAAGTVFYLEPARSSGTGPPPMNLHRYQLRERRATPFLEGIRSYTLSADSKRLLYQASGNRWGIVPTERPTKVGEGAIDVTALETWVDPRAEWAQIFRETWRIQREFFYDPQMHGADWKAVYDKYHALLPHVAHRADLTYLTATVGGELAVGHSYAIGTADAEEDPVTVGLLGADYAIENGRYRITRIYSGENWNPDLQAPLSAPGVRVSEGDYLLEVNGRPLIPPRERVPTVRRRRWTSDTDSCQQRSDPRGLPTRHRRPHRE